MLMRQAAYDKIFETYLDPQVAENRKGIYNLMYRSSVPARIWGSLKFYAQNLLPLTTKRKLTALKGRNIVLVGTKNHFDSLDFLRANNNYQFVTVSDQMKSRNLPHLDLRPKAGWRYLYNYLPYFYRIYQQRRSDFTRALYHLLSNIGVYEQHYALLSTLRPASIILSNDHRVVYRSLTLAAASLDIPTVYIQHACVGVDFPSLICRYSLLEGQDGVDKYARNGVRNTSEIRLIGMPKFDGYIAKASTTRALNKVGIAYNKTATTRQIKDLANCLASRFPNLEIILRRHPGDKRAYPTDTPPNVLTSDSTTETSFQYLLPLDVIIAPDSSIHLEAALLNVRPLCYTGLQDDFADVYHYVKNGLVQKVPTISAVASALTQPGPSAKELRMKVKYYCDTIDTPYEGRAGELATETLARLLSLPAVVQAYPK